jgi:hypothetical protein
MRRNLTHTRWLWLASGVLGLLALAYIAKGNWSLLLGQERSDGVDLKLRWTEQRYFLRGQNPYDVWAANDPRGRDAGPERTRADRPDQVALELGGPEPAHPPWGYISGLAFFWPEWPWTRLYYAALNFIGLLILAAYAFHVAAESKPLAGVLLATATLAIGGTCTALEVGQYGVLAVSLLAAALWLDEAGWPVSSGLLVGVALFKPTIAGPFFLALLARGRWRAATATLAYCGMGSLIAWAVTGTGPLEMLRQMAVMGGSIADLGTLGPIHALLAAGLDGRSATLAAVTLLVVPGLMALYAWPNRSLPAAFAVAAVVGRLWTYHKGYDNIMLVFLLVPLGDLALRQGGTAWLTFGTVGLSLWLPQRLCEAPFVQIMQDIVWLAGLAFLYRQSLPDGAAEFRRAAAPVGLTAET